MSDELAAFNRARWNALADANVEYSRPMLELTPESARAFLDPYAIMGDVRGKEVLCLAGGGGQQSAAFALLGANVTVFDLSDRQLERDREAAAHYGLTIRTVQGDMRYLNAFAAQSFDLVYQAYSINFVPSVTPVLAEVARVIRPGALYRIEWNNPFTQTINDAEWSDSGYPLRTPYVDGRELTDQFPNWTIAQEDGSQREIEGPRGFVHSLATMVNSLVANGFVILRAGEFVGDGSDAPLARGRIICASLLQYLTFWARYRPELLV